MSRYECKDKRGYATKREADIEIYRIITESAGGAVYLRSYKCKYCKFYHLTSSQK
jgi:hypothetical protein